MRLKIIALVVALVLIFVLAVGVFGGTYRSAELHESTPIAVDVTPAGQ